MDAFGRGRRFDVQHDLMPALWLWFEVAIDSACQAWEATKSFLHNAPELDKGPTSLALIAPTPKSFAPSKDPPNFAAVQGQDVRWSFCRSQAEWRNFNYRDGVSEDWPFAI